MSLLPCEDESEDWNEGNITGIRVPDRLGRQIPEKRTVGRDQDRQTKPYAAAHLHDAGLPVTCDVECTSRLRPAGRCPIPAHRVSTVLAPSYTVPRGCHCLARGSMPTRALSPR